MSKLGLMLKDKNKREREVWTHAIRPDPSETESQSPPVGRIRGYDPPVGPTTPWQPSDAQQSAQIPSEREPPLPFTRVPLTSTPPLLTWGPTTRWRDPLVDGAPRCRFSPCPLCFLLINHIYFFYFMGSLPPKWRKWKCSVIHHPVSTVIFFKKKIPTQCSAFPNHHHLVSCTRFSLIMAVVLPPLLK